MKPKGWGDLAVILSGSLPLRVFFCLLLFFSFFSVLIGSADPWWRVKEWMILVVGGGWWAWRMAYPPPIRRSWTDGMLSMLFAYIVLNLSILQILPIMTASGSLLSSPWPWLVFLHLMVISIWLFDGVHGLTKKDLSFLSEVIAGIGVFLSIYMILQKLSLDPWVGWLKSTQKGFRWLDANHVIGFVGNPFQASMCLAVCVPALVALRWNLLSILSALALLATQSTSGIVSAYFGAFLVLLRQGRSLTWKILLGLGIAGLFRAGPTFFKDSGRIEIWLKSLQSWWHRPWLGYGLGQYKMLGITLSNPAVGRPPTAVRWAHNEWVQTLCELGSIGMILLILNLIVLGRNLRQRWQFVPPVWTGILASCLLLSMTAIPWHLAPTAVITLIALMAVIVFTKEAK